MAAQIFRATGKQVSLVEVELSNVENVLALINPEEPPRTQLHFNVVGPYSFTEREREKSDAATLAAALGITTRGRCTSEKAQTITVEVATAAFPFGDA